MTATQDLFVKEEVPSAIGVQRPHGPSAPHGAHDDPPSDSPLASSPRISDPLPPSLPFSRGEVMIQRYDSVYQRPTYFLAPFLYISAFPGSFLFL